MLAIEHMWAIPLRDAVRDAGGIVLAHHSITAEDLVAFGMDVGDTLTDADSETDTRGLVGGDACSAVHDCLAWSRRRSSSSAALIRERWVKA